MDFCPYLHIKSSKYPLRFKNQGLSRDLTRFGLGNTKKMGGNALKRVNKGRYNEKNIRIHPAALC